MKISHILYQHRDSSKIAIKQGDEKITYTGLFQAIHSISSFLSQHNELSQNVILYLPNSIGYVIAYFSILQANQVVLPINIQESSAKVFSTAAFCDSNVIITNIQSKDRLTVNLSESQQKSIIILLIEDLLKGNSSCTYQQSPSFNPDTPALILNTSGSTSTPKMVVLSHSNLYSNMVSCSKLAKITSEDIGLVVMPLCSSYANTEQLLAYLHAGMTIVLLESFFTGRGFYSIIEKEKITRLEAVPAMIPMILEYKYGQRYNISSLRYFGIGGGGLSSELLQQMFQRFPNVAFIQSYGLTEASPLVSIMDQAMMKIKLKSVGKILDNLDYKISLNEDSDRIGELSIRGAGIMKGYYHEIKETDKVLKDGWLNTGDLAEIDEDGYLYIVGRKKNLIKCSGYRVSPEEIEEILLSHPLVKDALVYGKSSQYDLEILSANLVLNDAEGDCIEQIKNYCRQYLPRYKIPSEFNIVVSIPKTMNGKIKRGILTNRESEISYETEN